MLTTAVLLHGWNLCTNLCSLCLHVNHKPDICRSDGWLINVIITFRLYVTHTQTDLAGGRAWIFIRLQRLQCITNPLFSTFILDFITGYCLSFSSKCTSSPNLLTPRHIFLCASPSVNLHRNPNGAAGSRGVRKLPECHCIINDFDNNTFIFIFVSFGWSPYCGDFCQIVMEQFSVCGFSPGLLLQSERLGWLVWVCVVILISLDKWGPCLQI